MKINQIVASFIAKTVNKMDELLADGFQPMDLLKLAINSLDIETVWPHFKEFIPEWKKLSQEEKSELVNRFAAEMDLRNDRLENQIEQMVALLVQIEKTYQAFAG